MDIKWGLEIWKEFKRHCREAKGEVERERRARIGIWRSGTIEE